MHTLKALANVANQLRDWWNIVTESVLEDFVRQQYCGARNPAPELIKSLHQSITTEGRWRWTAAKFRLKDLTRNLGLWHLATEDNAINFVGKTFRVRKHSHVNGAKQWLHIFVPVRNVTPRWAEVSLVDHTSMFTNVKDAMSGSVTSVEVTVERIVQNVDHQK